MVATRHVTPRDGDVLLLVGTMKGAFLFRSNAARIRWEMGGPYFPGEAVYALAYDGRDSRRLWAGGGSDHWGPTLRSSDDFGRTWTNPVRSPVRFPDGMEATVKRIWQIVPGPGNARGKLYIGAEPTSLFVSSDGGTTWELNRGLWDHPHRPQWQPGGGGQCLHTIVPDPTKPGRIFLAMSTGGFYRSDDGGRTWRARNVGVRAEFMPDKYPEFGQCVHKVVHHSANPERLFLQNHWGLYRSDDAGDSWQDIANGVPSDFGFAMAIHPHSPETVYILPIESDMFRCTPEAKLRVYRTRDAGASWEPLTRGLPQKNALENVLRDAMDTDVLNPAGVYFGTRSGKVYGSANGGSSWIEVMTGLPPVTCVKACVVGTVGRVPKPKATPRRATAKSATRKAGARKTGSQKMGARKAGARKAGAGKTGARKMGSQKMGARKAGARKRK